jgi:ribose transport system permease protein
MQSLAALAIMVVGLSLATDSFFAQENGLNVLRQISINLCLSIGMTMVILSGGIDLSVGSALALTGAVAAGLIKQGVDIPAWDVHVQVTAVGAVLAAIGVGLAIGWCNGYIITRWSIPPFVATLGMLSAARGFTLLWTNRHPITGLGADIGFLGTGRLLGVPMPTLIAVTLAAVFFVVTRRTRLGRYLYAIGGNERAAELSGLNVRRTKLLVYTLCGGLAGVAGVLAIARLDAATPYAGVGYELDSIAAVVIGGTSLSGGRGSILGTVLGCLIIGVLDNGLILLKIPSDWQLVVKGVVLIAAVAIDNLTRRER